MALALEEASQIESVDAAIIILVNRSEGSQWRVVVPEFEASLQGIQSTLQIDFLLNDLNNHSLNIEGEAIEPTHESSSAIESTVPQEVVSAWKEEL